MDHGLNLLLKIMRYEQTHYNKRGVRANFFSTLAGLSLI
jgi:hypothetical protein